MISTTMHSDAETSESGKTLVGDHLQDSDLLPRGVNSRRSFRARRTRRLVISPVRREVSRSVMASMEDVSIFGLGFYHSEELPAGSQFVLKLAKDAFVTHTLLFKVMHSTLTSDGVYRTGAELMRVLGEDEKMEDLITAAEAAALHEAQAAAEAEQAAASAAHTSESSAPIETPVVSVPVLTMNIVTSPAASDSLASAPVIIAPKPSAPTTSAKVVAAPVVANPVEQDSRPDMRLMLPPFPPGHTEVMTGGTLCNWERELDMRRDGDRMWIYIHSPGKKNGWGIYVDHAKFAEVVSRFAEQEQPPMAMRPAA